MYRRSIIYHNIGPILEKPVPAHPYYNIHTYSISLVAGKVAEDEQWRWHQGWFWWRMWRHDCETSSTNGTSTTIALERGKYIK